MKNTVFTNFEDQFWIECLGYFLYLNMCSFQYIWRVFWSLMPKSSGQSAELIVYIIPPEKICIVTKSYWNSST